MPWYKYSSGAPFVWTRFIVDGIKTSKVRCLVDSGATETILPCAWFRAADIPVPEEEAPIPGLLDANGNVIHGTPFSVTIAVEPLGPFETDVYLSSTVNWGLLGQKGFFDHRGLVFENFRNQRAEPSFAIYHPLR